MLAFKLIDDDNSGQLDIEELLSALNNLSEMVPDLDFTRSDVEKIFAELDVDNTGLLTYSQFLLATLDPQLTHDEELLEQSFLDLDTFSEGFLTKEALLVASKRKGQDVNEQTIEQALQRLGLSSDDQITLDVFIRLISEDDHSE